MAVRVIYLIRHGQHDQANPTGSELGGSLTPLGVKQAEATARVFKSLPVSSIHTSSLNRAEETARIISRQISANVPVQQTELLWECIPALTAKVKQEIPAYTPVEVSQDKQRADVAFRKYFKVAQDQEQHDIIVCHGNLIRYFVTVVLKADPASWVRMDICNCGITQVLIQPEGDMVVLCHNDWAHLPRELRTSTLR